MEPERRHIKETSSLSKSRKGPKTCYGATRNPESTADYKLVTHKLSLSDTLQGLAIKYGVTVEQIRRVNKLWTNDNILIFKTINIPVKLSFDDGLTENALNGEDSPGTAKDIKGLNSSNIETKNQEYDCKESVDSGVHEMSHADIDVNIEHHSRITSERPDTKRDGASRNKESLHSFLKNLDGDIKATIQKAKRQRSSTVPALIHSLEKSSEKERLERHKEIASNVRLKTTSVSRNRTRKYSESLDDDSGSLDDLFEL